MSDERTLIEPYSGLAWGVYDVKDDCWVGNDNGPVLFADKMLARVAAQVTEDQLYGSDLGGRHEARVYPGGPLRLRDEVKALHTPLESLRRIEGANDEETKPPVKIEVTQNPAGKWVRPPNE